ncbi:unnamed protein product, partial [Rotaria sp. Silwood1]
QQQQWSNPVLSPFMVKRMNEGGNVVDIDEYYVAVVVVVVDDDEKIIEYVVVVVVVVGNEM